MNYELNREPIDVSKYPIQHLSLITHHSPQAEHLSFITHNSSATYSSHARNPLIADVCYKAGYIDSWGRGVEKIADACKEAGLPAPHIFERSGGMVVELKRQSAELSNSREAVSVRAVDDFGKISERIRKDFGYELAKAFDVISRNPEFTAKQIADEIGKTSRTVENYLAKLKETGIIVRRGPKFGGHWEVIES